MTVILSLLVDEPAQAHLDDLRTRYFPADRLVVGAHITMFHALPDELQVDEALRREVAGVPAFEVEVTGLRSLGRGVALVLSAPPAVVLRAALATAWRPLLSRQDTQPWTPHVTIQNKVPPATAGALLARLSRDFRPWTCTAVGIGSWRYAGGPWELLDRHPFPGDHGRHQLSRR